MRTDDVWAPNVEGSVFVGLDELLRLDCVGHGRVPDEFTLRAHPRFFLAILVLQIQVNVLYRRRLVDLFLKGLLHVLQSGD